MRTAWLVAFVAVALPGGSLPAQTCGLAFTDTLSLRTIALLERAAAQPPVWDDYSMERHPVLLLADSTHTGNGEARVCAAIWRAGSALERISLQQRPQLATPLYGMLDVDSPAGSVAVAGALWRPNARDAATLRSHQVAQAVFLEVPLDFSRLGDLGRMLSQANADPAFIQAELAVHETFHLYAQFPTWLSKATTFYAWPAWDRQPDRRQLRDRCYRSTPDVASAVSAELAELLGAFDALYGESIDTSAALSRANQFVALRNRRHAMLDTVRIQQDDRLIGCREAEDLLELEEGVAQWVGHATMVRAGLRALERYRGSYAGSQPDVFYLAGPLQLWVLQGLLGDGAMRDLTAQIARSANRTDGALFAVFARHANR